MSNVSLCSITYHEKPKTYGKLFPHCSFSHVFHSNASKTVTDNMCMIESRWREIQSCVLTDNAWLFFLSSDFRLRGPMGFYCMCRAFGVFSNARSRWQAQWRRRSCYLAVRLECSPPGNHGKPSCRRAQKKRPTTITDPVIVWVLALGVKFHVQVPMKLGVTVMWIRCRLLFHVRRDSFWPLMWPGKSSELLQHRFHEKNVVPNTTV